MCSLFMLVKSRPFNSRESWKEDFICRDEALLFQCQTGRPRDTKVSDWYTASLRGGRGLSALSPVPLYIFCSLSAWYSWTIYLVIFADTAWSAWKCTNDICVSECWGSAKQVVKKYRAFIDESLDFSVYILSTETNTQIYNVLALVFLRNLS